MLGPSEDCIDDRRKGQRHQTDIKTACIGTRQRMRLLGYYGLLRTGDLVSMPPSGDHRERSLLQFQGDPPRLQVQPKTPV
jgi:hypothetical protein